MFGRLRRRRVRRLTPRERAHYLAHREAARACIRARVTALNRHYGFSYNRIAIRAARTRWGSCSAAGNLNFHYALLFLAPPLRDYVIVHELCHLREFNHAPAFWALVARTVPDYSAHRRALRAMDPLQFARSGAECGILGETIARRGDA